MKLLITLTMLLSLFVAVMVPARTVTAQQDICAQARDTGNVAGYDVVSTQGGAGSQVVLGDEDDNILRGGGGHDILCGFGGDDTLRGGSGHDILVGGEGADGLYGQSGNDTLYGDGDDTVLNEGTGGGDQTFVVVPTFTYTVGAVVSGRCTISFSLTNGPISSPVSVEFEFADNEETGAGSGSETDDSGTFTGVLNTLLFEESSVTSAVVIGLDGVIAEAPAGQVCG